MAVWQERLLVGLAWLVVLGCGMALAALVVFMGVLVLGAFGVVSPAAGAPVVKGAASAVGLGLAPWLLAHAVAWGRR